LKSEKALEALKQELLKEQAESLGSAGKSLQAAIQTYKAYMSRPGAGPGSRQEQLLSDIVDRVWGLAVQRELAGIIHNNIESIVRAFDIPPEALDRLGIKQNGT